MTTMRSINKDFFPCYLDIQSARTNRALKWANTQSSENIVDSLYAHFLMKSDLTALFDNDKIHKLAEEYAEYYDNIDKLYEFAEYYLSTKKDIWPDEENFCRTWRVIVCTLFEKHRASQSIFDRTLYAILLNDFLWNVSLDPYNPLIQSYNLKRIADIVNPNTMLTESIKDAISKKFNRVNIDVDDDGNVLIKKNHTADLAQYFNNSCRLMKIYRDSNNTDKLKAELAKIYYMNELIEIKYIYNQKRTADEQKDYKTFADLRSRILSTFKTYLTWILEQDKEFDFESFYASSPYSNVLSISQRQIQGLRKLISALVK